MVQRCTNPKRSDFQHYGGRGIKIADRWQGEDGFENFLADMGERPVGKVLGRKEADEDFSPLNCEWVPRQQTSAVNAYYHRPRRLRPSTREGRLRRSELLRKLQSSRTRETDKQALLVELNRIAPFIEVTP